MNDEKGRKGTRAPERTEGRKPVLYDVSLLSDDDVCLFNEGSHLRLYEKLTYRTREQGNLMNRRGGPQERLPSAATPRVLPRTCRFRRKPALAISCDGVLRFIKKPFFRYSLPIFGKSG